MTKRLVLLGHPVGHSLSPRIHRAAIGALGFDVTYEAHDVDENGMRAFAEFARSGSVFGANITMPHKALARSLADRLVAPAGATGAVNTWVVDGRAIVGHSTDGHGVRFAWQAAGLPPGGRVVVLGAGGAAAAAAAELASTHSVAVCARRQSAAEALADRLGVTSMAWGASVTGAAVVNATPVGMAGESHPPAVVEGAVGYLEMVYARGETPTEVAMNARGIPVASGLDMLLGQAIASFELWFGVEAPVEAMRSALNGSSAIGSEPKPPTPRR